MRAGDVDWTELSTGISELVTADDVAAAGGVLVDRCRGAFGATATAVWLSDGNADRRLIASLGSVPDRLEPLLLGRRRGSLRCTRDPDGCPTFAAASNVDDDHVVVTFWARFAPHDHLGAVRVGALDLLARAGAAALCRARDGEHARDAGLILQRDLLPEIQPGTSGEAAARYVSASDGSQVGGDWYDIIETPDGRIVLVIGDVAGHGIEAAVQMTKFRTALHSHLLEGLPASIAMARLNDLAVHQQEFATCCCVEIGPGRTAVVLAGHPPPIVTGPDNDAAVCTAVPGPMLGAVAHATYPEQRVELGSGETLLLYSDGLVENPGSMITEEIKRLCRATANAGTNDPEELVDHLIGLAGPLHQPRDDVALLAFRPAPALLALAESASPASGPIDRLPLSADLVWQLIDATPDALLVTNPTGTIVLANQLGETLFGYSRSELIGTSVDLLVPEHLRAHHAEHRVHYLDELSSRPMSTRQLPARRRDGSTILAEVALSALDADSYTYVIATIRPASTATPPDDR